MDRLIEEAKRAKNFIWTAAGDYSCEPLFLAFAPDGTADMYLNMIIGLSYKWYDGQKLERFFEMLGGPKKELYEGLMWLGLEQALYEKERKLRPALADIRLEYARENADRARTYLEQSLIERLRYAHCMEILGDPVELKGMEGELLRATAYSDTLDTDGVLEETKKILRKFFSYEPARKEKEKGVYFLQKVLPAFYSIGKVETAYVRARRFADNGISGEGPGNSRKKGMHYLIQASLGEDEEAVRQYVEACFGESVYTTWEQERIEKELCTGNHRESHLLFTRGKFKNLPDVSKKTEKEIHSFRAEAELQKARNREYYEKHLAVHQNGIRKLEDVLRLAMEEKSSEETVRSVRGDICPDKAWKAVCLEDEHIFRRKEAKEQAGFSVDIMIDASSSRKNEQEMIASQAYILSESLTRRGIPVQIYSYCSVRRHTVLQIYKTYEEEGRNREIFRYVSAGSNRDGLALRGAGYLMRRSAGKKRILIVLTDASPNDEQNASEGAFYRNKEYTDYVGVQDTVREVRALRQAGVQVMAVFTGGETGVSAAREIFGRDFVRIRKIEQFAGAVGRLLKEQIQG